MCVLVITSLLYSNCSQCVAICHWYDLCTYNGIIGLAPHWLKSVMVSYVACTDSENDKIRLTSHSNFVMVSYVAFTDCENDKIRWTSYSTFHTSCVQTEGECWHKGSMK